MIKHLPKMARGHYAAAAADSGSKWRAGASTSLAVLRSRGKVRVALARSSFRCHPPLQRPARSAHGCPPWAREESPRRVDAVEKPRRHSAARPTIAERAASVRAGAPPSTCCARAAR